MSVEFENMWDAMKQAHYKRTLEKLKDGIQNAYNAQEALAFSLNMVVDAIHAEAGTFWFYDRFGDNLIHPMAVYGGGDIMGFSLSPGEGVAGQVIETAQSVIIPDCQKDPRWAGKVDKKTGFCTKTMICVPLCMEDIAFGSIQIINKKDGLPFDKMDLDFTEKLAEAAAVMLTDQELLRGYVAYAGRLQTDTITYESIVCAPTRKEMERVLRRTNCFQFLSMQEKAQVVKLTGELYDVFEKNLERRSGKAPKKGLFGGRK